MVLSEPAALDVYCSWIDPESVKNTRTRTELVGTNLSEIGFHIFIAMLAMGQVPFTRASAPQWGCRDNHQLD